MKRLQNNFTMSEQSKRLLELGLPVDSADCYYGTWNQIQFRNSLESQNHSFFEEFPYYNPCWTVGRLIEIYEIVGENAGQCVSADKNKSRVERLVQFYTENVTMLNFSKLKD